MTLPLQLHNDVPVVHATATLNVAKSRTNVGIFFWQKVIYFQSIRYAVANFFPHLFCFFCIAKAHVDATFTMKRLFR